MDLYKKLISDTEDELAIFKPILKCVICHCDLTQNPREAPKLLCQNRICKNVWLLIPADYRRWFHLYNNFRSERKRLVNWLNRYNVKISEHLLIGRQFKITMFKNMTLKNGNDYLKQPDRVKITEKYNEYRLKSKLITEIDRIDRKIKNNMIDFCKPIKLKINTYNYEKQRASFKPF